jgi:hypothetical protein
LDLILSNDAKETVRFVCDSSGEINSIAQRQKVPQTIKLQWRSIGAHERLDEIARHRIVIVDKAVTEIADATYFSRAENRDWRFVILTHGRNRFSGNQVVRGFCAITAGIGISLPLFAVMPMSGLALA